MQAPRQASSYSFDRRRIQVFDISYIAPGWTAGRLRVPIMSKKPSKHGPNKAKSIIAQPLFRSRQERAGKGKGSYRREAFQSNSWEASYFLAA
eukprot:gene41892-51920_t